MTIPTFAHKSFTEVIDARLPPSWLRRGPTTDETTERIGAGLLSAGPMRSLLAALIDCVEQARETVLVASFLFSDAELCSALLDAHGRGVRIYMLTASETRLTSNGDDDFTRKMINEHKQLLDRLAGKVVLRSAGCFHAKFIVVDHQSAPRGWLSTANFNPALYQSRELGLELDRHAATQVAAWFCYAFWTHAEHELTGEKGRLRAVNEAPARPKQPRTEPVLVTTPAAHRSLREKLLSWINASARELWISSYGLEAEHEVLEAILNRAKAGVAVTVLTRPRPAVRDAVVALRKAGARVVAHDKLHAKAVVCDHGALIMTSNIAVEGLDAGFEIGVTLGASAADALRETFERWADTFPWELQVDATRAASIGEIRFADCGIKDGGRRVVDEITVKLADVFADDPLNLDEAPTPKFERAPDHDALPARVVYEWVVRAPRLPKGAKPLDDDNGAKNEAKHTPAYVRGSQRYIVLGHERFAAAARARAAELGAKVVLR